jgi:hypothetical protein
LIRKNKAGIDLAYAVKDSFVGETLLVSQTFRGYLGYLKDKKRGSRKPTRVGNPIKNKKMATVVTRHKVGDINAWIKGHQDRLDIFAPAMTSYKAFEDVDYSK